MLNELQKDLLTELVNVYVGQAANMLSEIVDRHIVLNIPDVELISFSDVDRKDRRYNIFSMKGIYSGLLFNLAMSFKEKLFDVSR